MKKVLFISKVPLNTFPRLLSIMHSLTKIGHNIIVIAPGKIPQLFKNSKLLQFMHINSRLFNTKNFWGKVYYWAYFRIKVGNALKKNKDCLVWISSGDTAVVLFGILEKYDYILQINELYDQSLIYRILLNKISQHAKSVVVPETNRAFIIQAWYKLNKTPFVLPNKIEIPTINFKHTGKELKKVQRLKLEGYKILIYQGHLSKDRDLTCLIKNIKTSELKLHLLLVGKDHGILHNYLKHSDEITWIPHITPPNHLLFTSFADIGVLYYKADSLNNIFCAPNKIWEYSKFGLPMLTNYLPGLFETIKGYKAGESCDFSSHYSVMEAIKKLIAEYSLYSRNSTNMYNSLNLVERIREIIRDSMD